MKKPKPAYNYVKVDPSKDGHKAKPWNSRHNRTGDRYGARVLALAPFVWLDITAEAGLNPVQLQILALGSVLHEEESVFFDVQDIKPILRRSVDLIYIELQVLGVKGYIRAASREKPIKYQVTDKGYLLLAKVLHSVGLVEVSKLAGK